MFVCGRVGWTKLHTRWLLPYNENLWLPTTTKTTNKPGTISLSQCVSVVVTMCWFVVWKRNCDIVLCSCDPWVMHYVQWEVIRAITQNIVQTRFLWGVFCSWLISNHFSWSFSCLLLTQSARWFGCRKNTPDSCKWVQTTKFVSHRPYGWVDIWADREKIFPLSKARLCTDFMFFFPSRRVQLRQAKHFTWHPASLILLQSSWWGMKVLIG